MTLPFLSIDPLDLEVRPGVKVGDLKTLLECEEAMNRLDAERQTIIGQIARDEAQPGNRPPGWRASAQGALRWKKRIRAAVYARWQRFHANDKRRPDGGAILTVISNELSDEERERITEVLRAKLPELFGEGGQS